MRSFTRALLGAGGIGLLTGLLWFLLETTARFALGHFTHGARPPDDYFSFLIYYCLAGLAAGLALALAGWRPGRSRKRLARARLLVWCGVPAVLLVASHLVFMRATALEEVLDRSSSPGPGTDHPNVLLLSIDTLRADRLHAYGYPRDISPRMDRLAREGVLFERVIAHSPWTQPSFASILTSRYPSQHGSFALLSPAAEGDVGENMIYQSFLQDHEETLAEILAEQGYTTLAVQAICAAEEVQRFDQGFEVYLCGSQFVSSIWEKSLLGIGIEKISRLFGMRAGRRSGGGLPEANRVYRTFERLTSRVLPQPFFAWISFRDPHSPYLRRQDGVPLEDARVVESLAPEDASIPIAALSEAYDEEVRFVDHFVGKTVDLLRQRGILDQTIVVLTSDHGEEFGDHQAEARLAAATMRGRFHGHSLYSELLHVPLIVRYPPKIPPGTRIESLARHVDLLPTILDLAGLDAGAAAEQFEGASLLPLVTRGGEGAPRLAYSERNLFGAQQRSIQDGRYKLILEIESGRIELYDLAADPEERENLAAMSKDEADRLLALLDLWAARMGPVVPPTPEAASDPDAREALRALGYVQ